MSVVLPFNKSTQTGTTDIAQRRQQPKFLIFDSAMRVLFASPGVEELLPSEVLGSLESQCRKCRETQTVALHVLSEKVLLRIVPLGTQLDGCVALFADVSNRREASLEAASKFGLTRREMQVLQLLLQAATNANIAVALVIAESTVADHVKSVMRKIGVTRRMELPGKLFHIESELVSGFVS
jgi:DNA-binding CsgD family transcriptional regulator